MNESEVTDVVDDKLLEELASGSDNKPAEPHDVIIEGSGKSMMCDLYA